MGSILDEVIAEDDLKCELRVTIGTPIVLRIKGVEKQLKSHVVGFQEGEYMIVRKPKTQLINSKLYQGNKVAVHYFADGAVMGFQCSIIESLASPFHVLLLDYPSFVAKRDLRHSPRANCTLPGTLLVHNKSLKGILVNISDSGCRIVIRKDQDLEDTKLQMEDRHVISFFISEEVGHLEAKVVIRFKSVINDVLVLGLQFEELDSSAFKTISRYVKTVISHSIAHIQNSDI